MTDIEKDINDVEKAIRRKAVADFSAYRTIILQKLEGGRCLYQIDDARVVYRTPGMFAFHLQQGLAQAQQLFQQAGTEQDRMKAEEFALSASSASKVVLKRTASGTRAICEGFDCVFSNKALTRLMAVASHASAIEHLNTLKDGIS